MIEDNIISLLKSEMIPAFGVTELSSVALACSKAYEVIGGRLKNIDIVTDPGIFKNCFSCVIPGTNETGAEIAAVLGVLAGSPKLKLEILMDVKDKDIDRAKKLVSKKIVKINIKNELQELFIDAKVTTDNGIGRAIIKKSHTNFTLVESNGNIMFQTQRGKEKEKKETFDIKDMKLVDFINFVDTVSFDKIKFILKAVNVNKELAKVGMDGAGMGVGKAISELIEKDVLTGNLINYAQMLTSCAVDARVGGIPKPAMSISGSGTHGIMATMPLSAVAEKMKINEEKVARAIALSYLITIYIKEYSGKLSAFCGCAVAAGTGASGGIVYLLGGNKKQCEGAINNVAANLTGLICDGGNFGCALKAMTGAGVAIMSALFALNNTYIQYNNGIIGQNVEETMKNMGKIASPGMIKTNEVILDIMTNK